MGKGIFNMNKLKKEKYVEHELVLYSEVFGENPMEYQNNASPTVKELCEYFYNKGLLSQDEKYKIENDNSFEPFMFFYGENPITNEHDKNYSFKELSKIISSNDVWFLKFKNNFKQEI